MITTSAQPAAGLDRRQRRALAWHGCPQRYTIWADSRPAPAYTLISGFTGYRQRRLGHLDGGWRDPSGSAGYTFALSGNDVTLTFNAPVHHATATTYSLAAVAANNNVLVNQTTAVNSTITNTGTGTADTLTTPA